MTIAWILCYLLVGALLLTAALGADRIAAALRWSRRAVLSAVMLAMCVMPLLLRRIAPPVPVFIFSGKPPAMATPPASVITPPRGSSPAAPIRQPAIQFTVSPAPGNRLLVAPDSPVLPFDRWALVVWIAAAAAYAGLLLGAYRRMRHARRHWTAAPAHIERCMAALTGVRTRVWCSDDIGPAAFGVIRPAVVIPDWALSLDAEALDLLLRHEASHITSRDPLLLRVALAAVIAMPWNVPLLIAYRRLHRAVEHDCDARVIADTQDARGYARLLLETASRFAGVGAAQAWSRTARWLPAPVPGIGTRQSELELRLRALVQPISSWRSRVRMIGAGAVVVAALLVACSVPSPERLDTASKTSMSASGSRDKTRLIRPTPGQGTPAPRNLSVTDSLALYEQVMTHVGPRARLLGDSIITAEARRAEPYVFDARRRNDDDVWLLLDEHYHAIRSNTGHQYYTVNSGERAETDNGVAATLMTPRLKLISDTRSYTRAFPGLQLEDVGMWSLIEVHEGAHTVRVLWARFVPKSAAVVDLPDSITLADMIGASERARNATRSARQSYGASFDTLLQARIAAVEPRALSPTSTDDPFVWILLDQKANVLAHGIGREGMQAKRNGRYDPADDALATRTTPIKDLVLGCDAFRRKFPDVAAAGDVSNCGWSATTVGARPLNISWAVSGRFP